MDVRLFPKTKVQCYVTVYQAHNFVLDNVWMSCAQVSGLFVAFIFTFCRWIELFDQNDKIKKSFATVWECLHDSGPFLEDTSFWNEIATGRDSTFWNAAFHVSLCKVINIKHIMRVEPRWGKGCSQSATGLDVGGGRRESRLTSSHSQCVWPPAVHIHRFERFPFWFLCSFLNLSVCNSTLMFKFRGLLVCELFCCS